jgi:hypothetical protein
MQSFGCLWWSHAPFKFFKFIFKCLSSSAQAAAHVQFNIARTRMLANQIGFLFDGYASPERSDLLALLRTELNDLQSEYFSMLYGGPLKIAVSASPRITAHGRDRKHGESVAREYSILFGSM